MTRANFTVAETGGVVICTSEGNAGIGSTVPPLLISSIGIEKPIPRARDLGVFSACSPAAPWARQSARDANFHSVRSNRPSPAVNPPDVPDRTPREGIEGGVGSSGHLAGMAEVRDIPAEGESVGSSLRRHLEAMGGRSFEVAAGAATSRVPELFPGAKLVCSAAPEVPGTWRVAGVADPRALAYVDVGAVRSRLGVAEAGAVWFDGSDPVLPALGVLAQHLVVLLDPAAIVPTLHEANGRRLDLAASPYGVFMTGPSATGDIEGVIIHGAQGARSLTALLLPAEPPGDDPCPA